MFQNMTENIRREGFYSGENEKEKYNISLTL